MMEDFLPSFFFWMRYTWLIKRQMKFEFVAGRQTGIEEWNRINRKLENDLQMITEEEESEENIREYLTEMISCLQTVENGKCEEMLFLMFDKPASMPADVRVEYVYRPTYMATTMLMTAMNRFPLLHTDTKFRNVLYALMNASLARGFCGAGKQAVHRFRGAYGLRLRPRQGGVFQGRNPSDPSVQCNARYSPPQTRCDSCCCGKSQGSRRTDL